MINSTRRVLSALFILGLVAMAASVPAIFSACGDALCVGASAMALGSSEIQGGSITTNIFWGVGMYLFWISLLALLVLELTHPYFLKKQIKRARRRR